MIRAVVREGCLLRIETDPPAAQSSELCVRGIPEHVPCPVLKIPDEAYRGAGRRKVCADRWQEAADLAAGQWKNKIRIHTAWVPVCELRHRRDRHYAARAAGNAPAGSGWRISGLLQFYSSACANYVTPYLYGTAFSGNSPADLLNTKGPDLGPQPGGNHFRAGVEWVPGAVEAERASPSRSSTRG